MRENLKSPQGREPGGLSGRPITAKVTSFVSHIYKATGGQLPIIGVGGIFNAEDAYDKIKAGASAVQIYTGWIYEGPGAVKRINQGLRCLLERDGLKQIADAVGVAAKND
jgi:dihydroorotate dehydrogenase